jgi:hypothetical protein
MAISRANHFLYEQLDSSIPEAHHYADAEDKAAVHGANQQCDSVEAEDNQ